MTGGRAVLLVRNPFVHDARVLRAAAVVRDLGLDPLVVAVTSTSVRTRRESRDGIPVLRLDPRSPLSALSALRRLTGRGRSRRRDRAAEAHASPTARPPAAAVRLHRLLRTADFYRLALGVIVRRRPALLHCNDHNTMWVGVVARLLGVAVVYDSHELWPDRNGRTEPRWWLLTCEWLFVRCAHATVTASPAYADVMAERYRVPRPGVVLNVPDTRRPASEGPPAEPDLAVYAGGLQPHRGVEQSIDALASVPGLRLRLLGPGNAPYVESLRRRAASSGVSDRVEFAGAVPPGEVVDALRGAAFGIALFQPTCLSHRLVAPNKLYEYAAAGLPVLASDLPVLRAFVERWRLGIVVEGDDDAGVAAGMSTLLQTEVNARLRTGAVTASREVTWRREQRNLIAAYEAALSAVSRA